MQLALRIVCLLASSILGVAFALPARAWGEEGHEIVAVVAYGRLTPAARQAVDAILADDHDALTAPDFMRRATWADRYRDSDRNTTRLRHMGTRNWP